MAITVLKDLGLHFHTPSNNPRALYLAELRRDDPEMKPPTVTPESVSIRGLQVNLLPPHECVHFENERRNNMLGDFVTGLGPGQFFNAQAAVCMLDDPGTCTVVYMEYKLRTQFVEPNLIFFGACIQKTFSEVTAQTGSTRWPAFIEQAYVLDAYGDSTKIKLLDFRYTTTGMQAVRKEYVYNGASITELLEDCPYEDGTDELDMYISCL